MCFQVGSRTCCHRPSFPGAQPHAPRIRTLLPGIKEFASLFCSIPQPSSPLTSALLTVPVEPLGEAGVAGQQGQEAHRHSAPDCFCSPWLLPSHSKTHVKNLPGGVTGEQLSKDGQRDRPAEGRQMGSWRDRSRDLTVYRDLSYETETHVPHLILWPTSQENLARDS